MSNRFFLTRNKIVYYIDESGSLIGRSYDCQIRINDPLVSRHHAKVHYDSERDCLVLEDLESRNGTFVGSEAVTAVSICQPCQIRFGSITFRVLEKELATARTFDQESNPSTLSLESEHLGGEGFDLTRAEHAVLAILLSGKSEREAAKKLCVSPHTVHNHIRAIYKKTNVTSRAALMAKFIDPGTLESLREKTGDQS